MSRHISFCFSHRSITKMNGDLSLELRVKATIKDI